MSDAQENLVLLDCTIRDGNYVVDFKFTEADTRLLTAQLSGLGFEWIEVGHGLGLGAMEAGKGDMPASDVELIAAAKAGMSNARVGAFFIPGIGKREHIDAAIDAGLEFLRIGYDAPDAEKAFPFIEYASKRGLTACLNVMKSYAVTPEVFAEKSKGARDAGAEVIYCVDSAGGMLPDDVARYFDVLREAVDCPLGFHGHNNLMMAIANCVEAVRHGVQYIDTTLCGLGRSAGNAPTEMLIAVFERMGIATGIDLFRLMDVIESYMWPLVAQLRPHDMLGVAAGYSQFHSSFLPKVADAAQRHNVELRRLVAQTAQHDRVNLDENWLEDTARDLAGTSRSSEAVPLFTFQGQAASKHRIETSVEAVRKLIRGMSVACAKRPGAQSVLHLVPRAKEDPDVVIPEFAVQDDQMVMGRVTFGSFEVLKQVADIARPSVFMYLVGEGPDWSHRTAAVVADICGQHRVLPVRDFEIRRQFLLETVDRLSAMLDARTLLIYGVDNLVRSVLGEFSGFEAAFVIDRDSSNLPLAPNLVTLDGHDDWKELRLHFDLTLCSVNPTDSEAAFLSRAASPHGRIVSVMPIPSDTLLAHSGNRLVQIDFNLAYSGIVGRILAMDRILNRFDHSRASVSD